MAVQSSWQRYQAAWRDWQAQGGTGKPPQAVRDYLRSQTDARIAESRAKGYGPARFDNLLKPFNDSAKKAAGDKLAEQLNKTKKAPTKSEIRKAAKEGKTISATLPSTCFAWLEWQDGIATGEFLNKTQGVWEWECDLETFIEWAQSGSLGSFFNDVIR